MKIGNIEINPSKVVCLGRNYLDHIKETNAPIPKEPIFFVKTLNTLVTNRNPIIYPKILYNSDDNHVDHEVELAFVILTKCKNIKAHKVFEHIQGFTVFIDMTARKMQFRDRNVNLPWYRSKNFDSFGAIGPRIVSLREIGNPHNLSIELKLNGQIRQSSNTKNMLFKIPETLEYLSKFVTFYPGDIVATGTPSGISPVQPGDVIEASIEKIGTITHKVILEE